MKTRLQNLSRGRGTLAVFAVVMLLMGLAAGSTANARGTSRTGSLAPGALFEMDCVECKACAPTDSGPAHYAVEVPAENQPVLTADHTECMPFHYNACSSAPEHGTCPGGSGLEEFVLNGRVNPSRAEVAVHAQALIAAEAWSQLASLITDTRGVVRINRSRAAIQVGACRPLTAIMAHLPMSDGDLGKLAAELQHHH